jgi:hypothetical protein
MDSWLNSYFTKGCWRLARLFSWGRARDDEGSCLPRYAMLNNAVPSRNPVPAATKSNCPDIPSYIHQVALSPWQSSFTCGHIISLVTKWLTCSVFASIFDSFDFSCVLVFFKANCGVYGHKVYGLRAEIAVMGCNCSYATIKLQEASPNTKFTQQKVNKSVRNEMKFCSIKKRKVEFCFILYKFKILNINLSKSNSVITSWKGLNVLCLYNRGI